MPDRSTRLAPPNLLSILLIILLAASYYAPFADLDFAWQVRSGERIIQTGSFRPPEAFTYTIAGEQVPDFEWLYEVILWATWSAFGYGGLKLLRLLLVASTLLLLARRLQREGVAWHGIALTLCAAIYMLSPGWNLRPLYCTSIGVLLLTGWLHDHCTRRRPLPWGLPLLMLAWANLHPGVIVGQGLLAGAIAWEWLNRWVRLNDPLDSRGCLRLTVLGSLGMLATFIAPDPVERMLFPFRPELAHPVMRVFAEMQPLPRFLTIPPYTAFGAYALAALVLYSVVRRFRRYRLWEVALLLGLAVLANLAYRSLQDWVLIQLALGVPHLAAMFQESVRAMRRTGQHHALTRVLLRIDRRCKRLFARSPFRWQPIWLLLVIGSLAAISLIPPLGRRVPQQDAPMWPAAAVDWVERERVQGRFFAPADFGSYLTWRLGDRARSYVDTRGFFFPPMILEDSNYLPQLVPGWRERLDRVLAQGTDYFLLETAGPRGTLWHAFEPFLGAPLYVDDLCVLLSADQVRRAAEQFEQSQTMNSEPAVVCTGLSP
jgi:hypothetical protein